MYRSPFCYGNEENTVSCLHERLYLTNANQSEIRRAYLVSVMAMRKEDNAFSEEKMMIGVRSLALGICIIGREGSRVSAGGGYLDTKHRESETAR